MKIQINKNEVRQQAKKMNKQELQEHLKNMRNASSVHQSKKAYNRKKRKRVMY